MPVGRLKAKYAKHAADRDLHTHISEALRVLNRALDSARGVKVSARRVPHRDRHPLDDLALKRADEAAAKIRQARRLLESVGYLYPNVDSMDPDLLPESLQEGRSRARLVAVRELREARRRQQEQVTNGS